MIIVPGEKKRNSLGSGYEPYLNGVNEGKLLNSNDDDVDGSFESRVPSKASSGYGENIRASSSDKEEILPYVLSKMSCNVFLKLRFFNTRTSITDIYSIQVQL